MLKISHAFDAGAIDPIALDRASDIRVNIRADSHAEFRQWFYFRLQGARGQPCRIRFENAGRCTYVDGWHGYRAVASYDRRQWFRVPTSFDGTVLEIAHVPDRDTLSPAGLILQSRPVVHEPLDEAVDEVVRAEMRDVIHHRRHVDHRVVLQHAQLPVVEEEQFHGSLLGWVWSSATILPR